MKETTNYKFKKRELTDVADITTAEDNWDTADTKLKEIETAHAAHLAETALKHITESDNNANGYYTKFDDGTLICKRFAIIDENPALAVDDRCPHRRFTPPASFTDNPSVSCEISFSLSSDAALVMSKDKLMGVASYTGLGAKGTFSCSAVVTNLGAFHGNAQSASSYNQTYYSIIWVGRWK